MSSYGEGTILPPINRPDTRGSGGVSRLPTLPVAPLSPGGKNIAYVGSPRGPQPAYVSSPRGPRAVGREFDESPSKYQQSPRTAGASAYMPSPPMGPKLTRSYDGPLSPSKAQQVSPRTAPAADELFELDGGTRNHGRDAPRSDSTVGKSLQASAVGFLEKAAYEVERMVSRVEGGGVSQRSSQMPFQSGDDILAALGHRTHGSASQDSVATKSMQNEMREVRQSLTSALESTKQALQHEVNRRKQLEEEHRTVLVELARLRQERQVAVQTGRYPDVVEAKTDQSEGYVDTILVLEKRVKSLERALTQAMQAQVEPTPAPATTTKGLSSPSKQPTSAPTKPADQEPKEENPTFSDRELTTRFKILQVTGDPLQSAEARMGIMWLVAAIHKQFALTDLKAHASHVAFLPSGTPALQVGIAGVPTISNSPHMEDSCIQLVERLGNDYLRKRPELAQYGADKVVFVASPFQADTPGMYATPLGFVLLVDGREPFASAVSAVLRRTVSDPRALRKPVLVLAYHTKETPQAMLEALTTDHAAAIAPPSFTRLACVQTPDSDDHIISEAATWLRTTMGGTGRLGVAPLTPLWDGPNSSFKGFDTQVGTNFDDLLSSSAAFAIIFDSADSTQLVTARDAIGWAGKDQRHRSKPTLIIALNTDSEQAASPEQLRDYLCLPPSSLLRGLVPKSEVRIPTFKNAEDPPKPEMKMVIGTSVPVKAAPETLRGFEWLLGSVRAAYEALRVRVFPGCGTLPSKTHTVRVRIGMYASASLRSSASFEDDALALFDTCSSSVYRRHPDWSRSGAESLWFNARSFLHTDPRNLDQWNRLLCECFGYLIFIDATKPLELPELHAFLVSALDDPRCQGKPFLIVAVNSKEGTAAPLDLIERSVYPSSSPLPLNDEPALYKISSVQSPENNVFEMTEAVSWLVHALRGNLPNLKLFLPPTPLEAPSIALKIALIGTANRRISRRDQDRVIRVYNRYVGSLLWEHPEYKKVGEQAIEFSPLVMSPAPNAQEFDASAAWGAAVAQCAGFLIIVDSTSIAGLPLLRDVLHMVLADKTQRAKPILIVCINHGEASALHLHAIKDILALPPPKDIVSV